MQKGQIYIPYKLFNGAVIPNCLMKNKELSQGAKLCFARLSQYAGKDGNAYPSQKTLAQELGVCERTVRNYLKELITKKFIKSISRTTSNAYVFIWNEILEESVNKTHTLKDVSIKNSRKESSSAAGKIFPLVQEK